uniref:Uncharacterized protein n=1 Tax=Anguilla anguilla TaxID=7936 RepID=A0A0E9PAZ3_ANGAN
MFICLVLNLPYMVQFRYIFLIVMFLCVYMMCLVTINGKKTYNNAYKPILTNKITQPCNIHSNGLLCVR